MENLAGAEPISSDFTGSILPFVTPERPHMIHMIAKIWKVQKNHRGPGIIAVCIACELRFSGLPLLYGAYRGPVLPAAGHTLKFVSSTLLLQVTLSTTELEDHSL